MKTSNLVKQQLGKGLIGMWPSDKEETRRCHSLSLKSALLIPIVSMKAFYSTFIVVSSITIFPPIA